MLVPSPDRWARVKDLFQEALDQPAAERQEFIRRRADASILAEVESLLAAHEEEASDLVDVWIGKRVGPYRITRELGRGGMGAIYLAVRDDDEFRRDVAVKVIKRGMDTEAIVRRFRAERQILADLDHPNIARLLDGGTSDDGRPYFVMEFIDGQPLDLWCEEKQLSIRDRLKLMQTVCEAVDVAHRRGIVHRDLKPGNILVNREGVPKLVDFGIAKVLATDSEPRTVTVVGHQILTPAYASPEHLEGQALTPATDVFSLGVVLYETITGRRPFSDTRGSLEQIARIRASTTPKPPSDAVVLDASQSDSRRIRRQLRGDLDDIVMMALDPDAARRYPTAGELGRDLQRHLAGERVAARRRRSVERWRRFGAVAAAVVLVGLLIAGAVTRISRGSAEPQTPAAAVAVRSLAVLPLHTSGSDTEHLGLGIADAVILRLSTLPGITVRPTSAIRRFATEPPADVVAAGREMKVDAVLDGTLRRAGDRVRVTVQLIGVGDGATIWSGKFDENISEAFAFEDQISGEVTRALSRGGVTAAQPSARGRRTPDPQAYELYLRGRYLLNQRRIDSFRTAIRHFEEAIARDPNYAAAWAGLADSYLLLGGANAAAPVELYPKAKEAALRAIELDDTLAEAHTSLAHVKYQYDWDFPGADREYRRAIQLDPNYATAHDWYATFLSTMERHDEALHHVRIAQKLDPVSRAFNMHVGSILTSAGRYDEAIAVYRRAIEIEPNFANVWSGLGAAYAHKGDLPNALIAFDESARLSEEKPSASRLLEQIGTHARMGNRDIALRHFETFKKMEKSSRVAPYKYALIYALLGERDKAIEALERTVAERSGDILSLNNPTFEPYQSDPRFRDIVRRVGLPLKPLPPARSER